MSRLFHRIINRRMLLHFARQKAFRHGDGLGDNLWLDKTILDKKRLEKKKLNLAFADVAKAFDSVSHHSIIRAALRLGTPPNDEMPHEFVQQLPSLHENGEGSEWGDFSWNRSQAGRPNASYAFQRRCRHVRGQNRQVDRRHLRSQEKCNYIAFFCRQLTSE